MCKINIYIRLPRYVVESNNINTFKNRLDNFWKDQPILYGFKANITGAGNMSLENLKLDLTIGA